MREFITLCEQATPMRLGDLISVKVGNPDADFWITRRGSVDKVGEPTKTFNPEAFGITIVASDVLNPQYLYYVMLHLWTQGVWRARANGTTRLVSIKTSDILNIPIGS